MAFYRILVPHLPVPVSEASEAIFTALHKGLVVISVLVALVHIAAALRHQFVLKDGLLMRMIIPARDD